MDQQPQEELRDLSRPRLLEGLGFAELAGDLRALVADVRAGQLKVIVKLESDGSMSISLKESNS